MAKDTDALFALLQAEIPPVVALGGDEHVYVHDALEFMRERVLASGMKDFNWDRVSARDRKASDIVALACTLPVMAKQRLVEVKDAEGLASDLATLERYLDAPNPQTVVVLIFGAIDLRDKLAKLLDKKAVLARFDHPKERDMPRHVQRRAKRHKLTLEPNAVEALAATVGADLTLLERALEKLALVCTGAVTAADVQAHVADTHLEDAFAFVRAVANADRAAALLALTQLEAAREEPIRLLGLIAWQLRQLLRARALMDAGRQSSIASELSLFGDRLSATLSAAKRFSATAHASRLIRLAETDQALKGSRQPGWLVMLRLVEDLCAGPDVPATANAARAAPASR